MKHLLLTTIAAVVLVGCGESQQPEPPTAKAPDISIHDAAEDRNIEVVKQHIAAGTNLNAKNDSEDTLLLRAAVFGQGEVADLLIAKGAQVNAQNKFGYTPLDMAIKLNKTKIADLLRKHGGKTGEELKAEGK